MSRIDHARERRKRQRAGTGPVIRRPDQAPTKRQRAAIERMASELGRDIVMPSTREGASALIAALERHGATPPRSTDRHGAKQLRLARSVVAAIPCPRCLALVGEACRGIRGQARKGHHLERVRAALDEPPT